MKNKIILKSGFKLRCQTDIQMDELYDRNSHWGSAVGSQTVCDPLKWYAGFCT